MKKSNLALVAAMVVVSSQAWAVEVKRTIEVNGDPAKAWAQIGDFCGIGAWHPAVAKCELSENGGASIRTLSLNGGGTLVEALVSRDDAAMTYTYKIISGPLPVEGYESTIKVEEGDEPDESEIEWVGAFTAKGASDEEASKVIAGIYDAGLAALRKKSKE